MPGLVNTDYRQRLPGGAISSSGEDPSQDHTPGKSSPVYEDSDAWSEDLHDQGESATGIEADGIHQAKKIHNNFLPLELFDDPEMELRTPEVRYVSVPTIWVRSNLQVEGALV